MGTALPAVRQAPRGPSSPTVFEVAERIAMMCASALFTGLTEKECLEIASCARARTFARDEILFREGQSARNLVMIHSGSVKLSQLSASGNEVILWMTGSSDPVGVPAETEKVAKRLALALLRLVKQVGKPAYPGTEISLSRDELAQMTGTTLFTISRVLSKWAEEGFIEPRRGSVVVLDTKRLGQVCDEEE